MRAAPASGAKLEHEPLGDDKRAAQLEIAEHRLRVHNKSGEPVRPRAPRLRRAGEAARAASATRRARRRQGRSSTALAERCSSAASAWRFARGGLDEHAQDGVLLLRHRGGAAASRLRRFARVPLPRGGRERARRSRSCRERRSGVTRASPSLVTGARCVCHGTDGGRKAERRRDRVGNPDSGARPADDRRRMPAFPPHRPIAPGTAPRASLRVA